MSLNILSLCLDKPPLLLKRLDLMVDLVVRALDDLHLFKVEFLQLGRELSLRKISAMRQGG